MYQNFERDKILNNTNRRLVLRSVTRYMVNHLNGAYPSALVRRETARAFLLTFDGAFDSDTQLLDPKNLSKELIGMAFKNAVTYYRSFTTLSTQPRLILSCTTPPPSTPSSVTLESSNVFTFNELAYQMSDLESTPPASSLSSLSSITIELTSQASVTSISSLSLVESSISSRTETKIQEKPSFLTNCIGNETNVKIFLCETVQYKKKRNS